MVALVSLSCRDTCLVGIGRGLEISLQIVLASSSLENIIPRMKHWLSVCISPNERCKIVSLAACPWKAGRVFWRPAQPQLH